MNLPSNVIQTAKRAFQSQWNDYVTVEREGTVLVNNVEEQGVPYRDMPCHFSMTSPAPLIQGDAGETKSVFQLFVDTEAVILPGDKLTIKHNRQTFRGVAGKPYHGSFSNTVSVEAVEMS